MTERRRAAVAAMSRWVIALSASAITAFGLACSETGSRDEDAGEATGPRAAGGTGAVPGLRPGDGRRRVFLFGIDGASPKVTIPLMRKGRLPNLARVAREGAFGPLRSDFPIFSPRIWNTIATGKVPNEHGITAFAHKDEEGQKNLYLSSHRLVPAIWNIASAAGRSVGVVNWWTTYPPEIIDGVMVSDHFFPKQSAMIRRTFTDGDEVRGSQVYPEEWADDAEFARTADDRLVPARNPFANAEALPNWVDQPLLSDFYHTDMQITRVALAVEETYSPDLTMVFLPGIDRVSHWLWGMIEPPEKYPAELRPTDAERRAGAAALFNYYAYTDQLLGRLMRAADGDDLIMIVSDHGFEAKVSMMLLTGGHDTADAIQGVIYAKGPGIVPGSSPGKVSVFGVAPTILAWMGIPPGADMKGEPMAFVHIDAPNAIASHDDLEVERLEARASGSEEAMVEHLRALGYLEGEGVDENPSAQSDAPPAEKKAGDGTDTSAP